MPFTPSHVAAILPLCRGRWSRPFDTAALSVGAMVPDLPCFVRPHLGARLTHAWFGPVTVDLLLGLALLALWRLARLVLDRLAPHSLRARTYAGPVEAPSRGRWRDLLASALSLVVGATTHVVWDSSSHPHRWGTEHVAWLSAMQGSLPGYKWVQFASGVLGLLVVGAWSARRVSRTPPVPLPPEGADAVRRRRGVWVLLGVGLALVVVTTWARGRVASGAWLDEETAVVLAVHCTSAALGVLVVLAAVSAAIWWDESRHGRRTEQHAQHRTRRDAAATGVAGGDRRDGRS